VQKLNLPPLQTIEATGISLLTPNQPTLLIAVYKPPNIPLNPADIRALSSMGNHIILAGDINCKHQHWNSRRQNQSGLILYNALPTLDVYPVSTMEPTHFPRAGGRPDVLDIALVKGITITAGPQAIMALESDHIPVCLNIHYLHTPDTRTLPPIYQTDWNKYQQYLARTTHPNLPLHNPTDIENTVNLITANLKSAYRLHTTKFSPAVRPDTSSTSYQTDWNKYQQYLARTTHPNLPLHSPTDIENTVDLIT